MLREAHPAALEGDKLMIEFAASADFQRKVADEQKNIRVLGEALYEVTGRRLAPEFTLGEAQGDREEPEERRLDEEELVTLLKETFDAREVES